MKNVSEVLKSNNLKAIATLFFNLKNQVKKHKDTFEVTVAYRNSRLTSIEITNEIEIVNNNLMREYTDLEFELRSRGTHTVKVENDLDLTREVFLDELNSRIQQLRFSYQREEFEKIIITTFMAFRGSVDLKRRYIAVDILKDNISETYVKNLISILMSLDSIEQFNINFRELQPEYRDNVTKRNTQLRINLRWFYDLYLEELRKVNVYKANILDENSDLIETFKTSPGLTTGFIERIYFYQERIVKKKSFMEMLSKDAQDKEIDILREDLQIKDEDTENEQIRNKNIVQIANVTLPNECASCKDDYDIKDRTFLVRETDRPYLEIHHVVSFGSDKSGDVLENLVKLCPACHRALTPRRANEDYQRNIIGNILKNSEASKDYVKNFVSNSSDTDQLIDFVYEKLK